MKFFGRLFRRSAGAAATRLPAVQQRAFHAARMDRFTADWLSTTQSINQELRSDLDRLRARGRDLIHNNPLAAKFRQMVQNNIIGPGGIRLQVRVQDAPGRPDEAANKAVESAWKRWSAMCDVSGRMHLRDLCDQLVGGLPSDGEFLVRIVRGADARNPFNIALQTIDVDRIDTSLNGRHGDNTVIMGVEVDTYRRPVALHIFAAHPGDAAAFGRERIRVPMEDLIHGFKATRSEQLRGVPWMAPGMLTMHHLGNFAMSAVLAAEHGANHYGFFTSSDGGPPIGGEDAATGQQITTSQPGTYDTLPVGTTFQAHESKYPDQVFGPFFKAGLRNVASGWGVSYHTLGNDLEGVNYSSIRSGTLEERDRWASEQEWFIHTVMEPVYKAWLEMALISGQITMPNGSALPLAKREKFATHEWQARRWEWVDPKGDIEAKILMVQAGLMSPQDLAAAMGYDFTDVMEAIKLAQEIAGRYGVRLPAYDAMPGAKPAGEPAAPAPKDQPPAA